MTQLETKVRRNTAHGKVIPVGLELRNCWTPEIFPYRKNEQCPNAFDSDVKTGLENLKKAFVVKAAQAFTAAAASSATK
jgi:hypothetical protein